MGMWLVTCKTIGPIEAGSPPSEDGAAAIVSRRWQGPPPGPAARHVLGQVRQDERRHRLRRRWRSPLGANQAGHPRRPLLHGAGEQQVDDLSDCILNSSASCLRLPTRWFF